MLSSCNQHSTKERVSELRVALVVIWMKSFFNPLQLVGLQSLRQLFSIKLIKIEPGFFLLSNKSNVPLWHREHSGTCSNPTFIVNVRKKEK